MKKLLIDVNSVVPFYAQGRSSGVGRTTIELVTALNALREELPFEVSLYSQNMKGIGGPSLGTDFRCHHVYLPYREKWRRALQYFPLRELVSGCDLIHIPHNFELLYKAEHCIATIHDAMFFSHPEAHLGHERAKKLYPPFARRCRAIITCSENSKQEIHEYMGVPEERIHVVPWGIKHDCFHPRPRRANPYCGEDPYFLSVSCDIGRKNTLTLIRSFLLFLQESKAPHHLLLIWRNPPAEAQALAQSPAAQGRIHFAKDISDEMLAALYASAEASYFISLYEGFGLPVLESLASGTPCVTCRNSSLPEVGGQAALYVSPTDTAEIAESMRQFAEERLDIPTLVQASLQQAARFNWENTARATARVYAQYI